MITSQDFDKLEYKKPFLKDKKKKIDKIIGIDSEAYSDGSPMMICTSEDDCFLPGELPDVLFTPKYENANFMTYNIKYDAGGVSLFSSGHAPAGIMDEWRDGV